MAALNLCFATFYNGKRQEKVSTGKTINGDVRSLGVAPVFLIQHGTDQQVGVFHAKAIVVPVRHFSEEYPHPVPVIARQVIYDYAMCPIHLSGIGFPHPFICLFGPILIGPVIFMDHRIFLYSLSTMIYYLTIKNQGNG